MLLARIIRSLAAVCAILLYQAETAAEAGAPIRVVVSFSILKDLAEEIGGSDVAVTSLVGPHSHAHAFEPRPDQAPPLSQARLFIVNGLGLAGWLLRLAGSAPNPGPVFFPPPGPSPLTPTPT